MDEQLRERIDSMVKDNDVMLFMKGTRHFPQCGFSATVVQILDQAGLKGYQTFNVLSDGDVREGIKEYANWPTIPQLYVNGQLVGGCDIIKELFQKGELYGVLGVQEPEIKEPSITVTDAARQALAAAREEGDDSVVRIAISPRFEYEMSLDAVADKDFVTDLGGGFKLAIDRQSATRADGLSIDYLERDGGGFKIDNPNEPPSVQNIGVGELKALLDDGNIELFDVRTPEEREKAKIDAAQHWDDAAQAKLEKLDRDTPLYFHCHHGGRSAQAAEHYLRQGFTKVYNVVGGIDAWSQEVDPSVQRY